MSKRGPDTRWLQHGAMPRFVGTMKAFLGEPRANLPPNLPARGTARREMAVVVDVEAMVAAYFADIDQQILELEQEGAEPGIIAAMKDGQAVQTDWIRFTYKQMHELSGGQYVRACAGVMGALALIAISKLGTEYQSGGLQHFFAVMAESVGQIASGEAQCVEAIEKEAPDA